MTASTLFLRPDAWPWLAAVPVVVVALRLADAVRARRVRERTGPRAAVVARELAPRRRAVRRLAFGAGLIAAGLAALGPTWGLSEAPAPRVADVVVVLDVSRSMLARDVEPDRLTVARRAAGALAGHVRGDRLGLVVFSGEARRVVPLTEDAAAFADLAARVEPADVARGGTDLGAALDLALAGFPADAPAGTVLLVTDGEDLAGKGRASAARCAARGVVVHAFGVGTERGGKIPVVVAGGEAFLTGPDGAPVVSARDAASLAALARAGGGTYADLGADGRSLVEAFDRHVVPRAAEAARAERRREREDRYPWPLAAAFLLWLVDLGLPERRRR
ncbi:MAG: VWA domain-containing protein [Planctomycetes bacterium]|nr:VWA domain-containing protein [Planctomycetota bacterium]